MNFIVLEKEKLEKITSDLNEIKEAIQSRKEEDLSSSFIESKKIPKLLGISLKTWQTYRDKGQIPFIQFGSKIWVKRADLEAFMNSHYVKASA
jgi:excisionase family DNA binding protein